MRVYRKSLVWYQLACCDKCGDDYWCKTNLDKDFKPQGLCETCSQQSLDEMVLALEKAGLTHKIEELKRIAKS